MASTPEKQIENSILEFLHLFPGKVFCWKNNTTGVYDPTKQVFRTLTGFTITGVSDILGIIDGRFLAIEVKTPTSIKQWMRFNDPLFSPTKSQHKAYKRARQQKEFLNKVNAHGGLGFVAASLEDVQNKLMKHL